MIRATRAQLRTITAALAVCAALAAVAPSAPFAATDAPAKAPMATPLDGVVNVNSASVDQLQALPGVGETRAQAIVETRTRIGGFKKVDDLIQVKGIGEAVLARLRPYVRTEGKTTVRVN